MNCAVVYHVTSAHTKYTNGIVHQEGVQHNRGHAQRDVLLLHRGRAGAEEDQRADREGLEEAEARGEEVHQTPALGRRRVGEVDLHQTGKLNEKENLE